MLRLQHDSHRRLNPLTGEWVLVSPHRTKRPWQGQMARRAQPAQMKYDPSSYLCPGNARAAGHAKPAYTDTFVVENDYAALVAGTPQGRMDEGGLLVAE